MKHITISPTSRITIPAAIRRQLGWEAGTRLSVEVRGEELVLRRVRPLAELAGIFADYAVPGMTHERETELMEKAVAKQVMEETEG
jgi:AbrB family looped-hinge helix DNA binding protein